MVILVLFGSVCFFLVIFSYLWFFLVLFGSFRFFFIVFGSFWFYLVLFGSFTFLLIFSSSFWFFMDLSILVGSFWFLLVLFCSVWFFVSFYFFRVLFGVHTFSWPTFVNILPNKCNVIYHTGLAGSNLSQCIGSTRLTQIPNTLVH